MNRQGWRRPVRTAAALLASLLVGNAHAADVDGCTVDHCRTPDGFAIEIIGHKGQRPPAAGDTQAAEQDQRRADVTGKFLVRLPSGGMLWTTEDPAAMEPRLAVHAADTAPLIRGVLKQPVGFTVYTNYSAFIERAAVLVYDGRDIDRLKPIAQIEVPKGNYETVQWDGAGARFDEEQQIHYLVRAWDGGGRMDETAMHSLRLVDASRFQQNSDSAVTRSNATGGIPGANTAALPLNGNVLVFRPPQETTAARTQTYSLTPRFETRKVDISPRDRAELDSIIDGWRGATDIRIVTVGHTDNIRIAPQNRHEFANNRVLSEARAGSIANYVAVALGARADAITAIGRGPSEPVASNATAAGRAANRRVELTITGNRIVTTQTGPSATVELVEPASNASVAARTSLAEAERALRARLGAPATQGAPRAGGEQDSARAVLSAQGSAHALNAVYGRNDLARQNIPLYGSRVRLHGEDVGSSYGLRINGKGLPLDTSGRFAVEYLLPVGQHEFQVELVDADGRLNNRASVPVDVSGKHMFVVALADITLSGNDLSGSMEPLSQDDRFDDDFLVEGRLAFYLKGKIKGKYLVTAQMDTTEEELSDILSNLSEKNPRDVFRRLDPDRYYPVYGDDSTTIDDTNSQGRLYLRADWDNSHAMWGNFHTGFTGTEFAQYNRSLYGARVGWRSLNVNESGDAKTDATLFVSEAQTALGHSQFIGTGGSLYYLRHSDILPGSDKVHLEIRDRDSNRVRDNYTMQRGVDYEIDEIQGRIILSKPLMQIAPLLNPGLVKDSPLDGDQLVLMADYEYIPDSFAEDHVSVGGRGTHWFGDRLEVGATYVDEGRGGGVGAEDYQMLGADVTLKLGEGTYVKAEMAQTQASQTERFTSNDGGLSFAQSAVPQAGREGDAYGIEARMNTREAFGTENEWVAGAWYRRVDDNFSIARRDDGIDVTEYGAELLGNAGDRLEIGARAGFVEREGDIDDEALSLQAKYALTQRSTLAGEVRYVSEKDNPVATTPLPGTRDESGSLAALKYSYALTPAVEVYGVGQFTLSNDSGGYDNNDMATIGTSVRLGERFDLAGEYSSGHRGDGALLSLDYHVNPNHEIYGTFTQSADRTDVRRPGSQIALGHRSRLSDQTTVFNERQFSEGEELSGITHVFGLDFVPLAGWNIGFSLQNGDLETREGAIERDAGTVIVGFDGDALRATSKVEYRDENGVSDRRQWLTANRLDYRFSESLRMLSRFNWSETVDQRDRNGNAQFVEAGVGLAYRPVENSRFNMLAKYTYLYDLPSLAQGAAATDQRSNIVTVEGLYQLTQRWEIGGKYGIRMGELRADRDNGVWFESTTSFAALRGRFHVIKAWDALLEYRWLDVDEANSTRTGWLAGIDRHFGDHLKLGIGYNFTDFSDDLTDLNYDHNGWFINALGKY